MNTLTGYSKSRLTDNYVLTAAGGHLAVGNASNNIPLNNSTVNTNLNADLLDGLHGSWYLKNAISFKLTKGVAENQGYDVNTLTEGMVYNYGSAGYWKNGPFGMSYGLVLNLKNGSSNSLSGQLAWDVSNNNTTDTTRSLWWRASDNGTFTNAQWHKIAFLESIPNVTDYYWANIPISPESNDATTPKVLYLYATNGINTSYIRSSSSMSISSPYSITLSANDSSVIKIADTFINPLKDDTVNLGTPYDRWSAIYTKSLTTESLDYRCKGSNEYPTMYFFNDTWTYLGFFGINSEKKFVIGDQSGYSSNYVLHSGNSSISGGGSSWGSSITVKINGTSKTLTIPSNPNTHWTTRIYAGASGTAANAAATNPYLKVTDDNTYRNLVRFVGRGATTVSSDASGNITISSTNTTYDLGISDYTVKINGTTKNFVRDWGHGATNMNAVARGGRSSMGMADLSTPSGGTATAVNPNGGTSWHHFINIAYTDGGAGSNSWITQIANKAGTTDLWVRSRSGGTISDTAAWTAGWTRILTGSNYTNITDGRYIKKSGDTMTGALNFANGTWNVVGDDAAIGDYNAAGMLGLKSINNNIPGIGFHNSSNTLLGRLQANSSNLLWNDQTLIHSGNIGSLSVNYATSAGNSNKLSNLSVVYNKLYYNSKSVTMSTTLTVWYIKIVLSAYAQPCLFMIGGYYNNQIDRAIIETSGMSLGYIYRNCNLNGGNITGVWHKTNYDSSEKTWIFWVRLRGIDNSSSHYSPSSSATYTVYMGESNGSFSVTATTTAPSGAEWTGVSNGITIKRADLVGNATTASYCANFGTSSAYVSYDLDTNNTTDTWVPVMKSGKLQHRVIPVAYNNAPSTLSVNYANSAGNADTVDSLHASDFVRARGTFGSGNSYDSDWGLSIVTFDPIVSGTAPAQNPNISILNIGNNYARRKQLAFTYNTNDIYYRRRVDSSWSGWVRLAIAGESYTKTEADNRFVNYTGDTMTGSLTFSLSSSTRRNGIIGTYDPNRAAAIWSMGSSYQIATDGTTFGNLYGAAYAYFGSGYTFGANYSQGHSFVWCQNGTVCVLLGNGVWTSGNCYAAHFYENSDKKLKENIQAILKSDNIPQIKEFNWKESGEHSYGLIAQELEEQGYSELVSETNNVKNVNYSAALSLIVGKLQVKIKELEKEIEILKNKN